MWANLEETNVYWHKTRKFQPEGAAIITFLLHLTEIDTLLVDPLFAQNQDLDSLQILFENTRIEKLFMAFCWYLFDI